MHGELSRYVFSAAVAELSKVEAGEEVLARAHENGTDGEVEFIDQTGAKILPDGGRTAADTHVFLSLPAASRARSSAAWIPSVTK